MMKKILIIFAILVLAGCSKPGYEPQRAAELCQMADQRQLTPDETAEMIEQDRFALTDIRVRLEKILDEKDVKRAQAEFNKSATDTAFISQVVMSEKMWRILLLNRSHLTESNLSAYEELYELRRIVDLLNDDVSNLLYRK